MSGLQGLNWHFNCLSVEPHVAPGSFWVSQYFWQGTCPPGSPCSPSTNATAPDAARLIGRPVLWSYSQMPWSSHLGLFCHHTPRK